MKLLSGLNFSLEINENHIIIRVKYNNVIYCQTAEPMDGQASFYPSFIVDHLPMPGVFILHTGIKFNKDYKSK